MFKNVQVSSEGTSPLWVLFFIFLVLKLTHTISWSWWWVTAPLWIGGAVSLVILVIVVILVSLFGN